MKYPFALAILAFATASSAQARVGETQQEITARYGQGQPTATRLLGVETLNYVKNGFSVDVVMLDGKSAWEWFHRLDTIISDADIKDLIKANTTEGTSWHLERKDSHWERSGKPKLIASRDPGHPDYFWIKDVDAVKTAEAKHKTSAKEF